jgi:predicted dehydrogenase
MTDREPTVTVGVVGAGRVATHRHLPILDAVDGVEPGFVADVDADRAGRAARVYGYDAVALDADPDPAGLPACDAVLLATPLYAREPYFREFAGRDTPVFSEKPFAPDAATHHRYVDGLETVACNYMRSEFASLDGARAFLRSRPFGDLRRVEVRETGKVGALGLDSGHYQTDPSRSGGWILLERGCHTLSQLVALFPDDRPRVEAAEVRRTEGVDVDVAADLRLPGADVAVDLRISAVESVGSAVRLEFETATVTFDPAVGDDLRVSVTDADHEFAVGCDAHLPTGGDEAMYLRWESFLAAVRGDSPLDVPTATGLEVSRLTGDIRERGRRGGAA